MIYIHKGDDTDFNDNSFLTFNIITEKDLTNWKAKFILNGLEKTFEDITSKSFELHYSDEETSQFKLGKTTNELRLIDEEGKIKTVAKNIEISVTNEVIENESQLINLPILKDEGIDINISLASNSGSGGTTNHFELLYRDMTNQHPIKAITNLQEVLDSKQDKDDYALKSEIPTKSSELDNDSNYTTQTEVLALIASIPQFKLSIVEALPEVGEKMILYFVPKKGTENDIYDEYVWIEQNSNFEFLGSTAIDLTDYAKKEELNAKQDILVSGTNIKTINNEPILGNGNIEIKASENDYMPLGASLYFANIKLNSKWIKSEGQWNVGSVYKTFYNWLVEEKTTNTLRTDIKNISEEYTDFDYVLNQDEMLFRLPLLNGSENLPSNRYDDLELKATTESYIAPANGWYILYKTSGAAGETLQLVNDTTSNRFLTWSNATSKGYSFDIFAKRGDKVTAHYNFSGETKQFKFIYAQGNGDLYYYVD